MAIAPPRDRFTRAPVADVGSQGNFDHLGHKVGVLNRDVDDYLLRSDRPGEKFRVAVNLLAGGMPRRAERLIEEAVNSGLLAGSAPLLSAGEVAYRWKLAVLGGRSLAQLRAGLNERLRRAGRIAAGAADDSWTPALLVVDRLLACETYQRRARAPGAGALDGALTALGVPVALGTELIESDWAAARASVVFSYAALPLRQREEIRRDLDALLTGRLRDDLDVVCLADMELHRLGGGRRERAWKYFVPVPERPRRVTVPAPKLRAVPATVAIIGAVLAGTGLGLAVVSTALGSLNLGVITASLGAAGIVGLLWFGVSRLARYGRLADKDRDYGAYRAMTRYSLAQAETPPLGPVGAGEATGRTRRAEFRRMLRSYVDYRFTKASPPNRSPQRWEADAAGIKATLTSELLRLYDDQTPDEPQAVNWLVKWHVSELALRWNRSQLYAYRDRLRAPLWLTWAGVLSVASVAAAALIALVGAGFAQPLSGLLDAVLLLFGTLLIWTSGIDIFLVKRRRRPGDLHERRERYRDESRQYEIRRRTLADRPTDAEMVRWLEYDKLYIRSLALRQYGLKSSDWAGHAFVIEPGYLRRRARVAHGPWRYAPCSVTVFLLSDIGVRQVSLDVDTVTGDIAQDQERREDYRFDVIAAARYAMVGHRFDAGRRQVILLHDDATPPAELATYTLSRGFQVSFFSGQTMTFVVETYEDGPMAPGEDPATLLEAALDASGSALALRVLERRAAGG